MTALGQQTVPPESVMFWQNKDSDEKFDYSLLQSCVVTVSNANFGLMTTPFRVPSGWRTALTL